jgi:hypothetical protein
MKKLLEGLQTFHPCVQALLLVCSCGLIIVMLLNHDATTNFISILTLALYALGRIGDPTTPAGGKEQ